MIETRGLTKYYGSLAALTDLSLKINEGDIFGFIGPNGAGKTTTMRILATLLEPSRGQAFIAGLDVGKSGREVRRMVGYMPDFMGVYDDLKVFEYLEFFAAAFGLDRSKRKGVINDVLELTDLTVKRASPVDGLSRGMQQRLQLARVLIHDPKVLILDEPASGLDPRARIEIRELLRELKRMGKTIMISSHILSELEEMCDNIGIIEHGRLVFSGTMDQIRQQIGIHAQFRVQVVGDLQPAADVLRSLPQVTEVKPLEKALDVTLGDGEGNDGLIARTLVRAGIDVIAIVPRQLKLDDAFLQLTKGIVH
ncbi:MAG TPA: ABC transporter ATP-binding protein [Phycisphaerae bacterium]|nr:ABC transporter ATP-binding protein [Phycisphaerae bacterium]